MELFELDNHEFIELCDLLKVTGWCGSGGVAKAEIGAGRVRVDGSVELRKRAKIRSGQLVAYAGQQVSVT